MSCAQLQEVMGRIRGAEKCSQIAVFRGDSPASFNAVFANTIRSRRLIESNDPALIGVFDSSMDLRGIEALLLSEVRDDQK